jgi:uncharacterized protein (DUF427 family)
VLVSETGLPVRYYLYYLPPEDVTVDRLEPTATRTRCPYKGRASYWSYHDGDGRGGPMWPGPTRTRCPPSPLIEGRLSFYDDVAEISVDQAPDGP